MLELFLKGIYLPKNKDVPITLAKIASNEGIAHQICKPLLIEWLITFNSTFQIYNHKEVFILLFALSASIASFAQKDTSKIEQYCHVISTARLLNNKVAIDIDFGEQKNFWRDERLKTYDGKLKKFNTIIDAINFMGKEGWLFINAYPVTMGTNQIYHFAFKKLINRAELLEKELVLFCQLAVFNAAETRCSFASSKTIKKIIIKKILFTVQVFVLIAALALYVITELNKVKAPSPLPQTPIEIIEAPETPVSMLLSDTTTAFESDYLVFNKH